jgi:hypothetical protein
MSEKIGFLTVIDLKSVKSERFSDEVSWSARISMKLSRRHIELLRIFRSRGGERPGQQTYREQNLGQDPQRGVYLTHS